MDIPESEGGARAFPSTHWSQIYLAGDRQREEGARALGDLVQTYRRPLLVHLQEQSSCTLHQAEEWLDAFVERRMLEKELLRQANPAKGQFRQLLKTALNNFVSDDRRRQRTKKRHPANGFVPWETLAEDQLPPATRRPGVRSDWEWAVSVIDQARELTEAFYRAEGKMVAWEVFDHAIYLPLRHGVARPTPAALALRFGLPSEAQIERAIRSVKAKFGASVRKVVRKYAPSDEAVDDDIKELMAILAEGEG